MDGVPVPKDGALAIEELSGSGNDRRRVDLGRGKLLVRGRRSGHVCDGKAADPRLNTSVGKGCQDRFSKAALGPVIPDCHDPAGLSSRRDDRRRVDRLDRIEIDDARGDSFRSQAARGRDRLVEGDARAD